MNWLRKLPGFQTTPYGLECRVLRHLPAALLAGTAVPALVSVLTHAALALWADAETADWQRQLQLVDFMLIGLASLVWALALPLTIGCVIVWLMKGPAYVADAYELPGAGSAAERALNKR